MKVFEVIFMNSSERLTGPTNELAKERNRAAAERTLSAWINNCLTLIGFGLAITPISNQLRQFVPPENLNKANELAHAISVSFMLLGIGLLITAMVQHYLAVRSLERNDYIFIPSEELNVTAAIAVILFGFSGLFVILLGLS